MKIPSVYQEPLRQLVLMSPPDRRRLIESVRSATAVLEPDELIARVQRETSLGAVVERIIKMLLSMIRAADGPKEKFAHDVVNGAQALLYEQKPNIDWGAFSKDLVDLLNSERSLGVTAKVWDIRQEYDRVFCRARVLSDIRPIFGEDASAGPLAGAVVHTLRISYHEGADHRSVFIAMDHEDIRELRAALDRAIAKEASLKEQIKKTGMKYLQVEAAP